MFDHPWVRLALGVLTAAALGVIAVRVIGAIPDGDTARGGATNGGHPATGDRRVAAGRTTAAGGKGGGPAVEVSGAVGLTVHVAGAVRRPGVYRLPDGARVVDAVRKAGGATKAADQQGVNLAAELRDGQQVVVPERATAGVSGGTGTGPGVDLNTASAEDLQQLDGVGPTTAEKIVRLREQRGGLASVDDLDEIPGIGPKKLEALRAQLEG